MSTNEISELDHAHFEIATAIVAILARLIKASQPLEPSTKDGRAGRQAGGQAPSLKRQRFFID